MSEPAFFLPPENWSAEPLLEGAEARHAAVLRLKKGDDVLLLDGQGKTAFCEIAEMDKKFLRLRIKRGAKHPEPEAKAVMALALSKATRRGFFFEKASELGAWEIWLWQAEYSQGKISPALAENCQGRLLAGCKQSRNPWLPKARALKDVGEVIEQAAQADWRILPWEIREGASMLLPDQLGKRGKTVYVIGPEGGFSSHETNALFNSGFVPVSMGNRVLRCETAATLCLGLHWWASQLPGHPDFQDAEGRVA